MALTNSKKPDWVKSLEEKDKTTGTVVSKAADKKAASSTQSNSDYAYQTGTDKSNYVTTSNGGSSKNSQYSTTSLGDSWDANTDYQAIINDAVANGDYVTAAKAEQLRNQKITATGSNYNKTNMYAGHLSNVDYGTMLQQLMANNASAAVVQNILDTRTNKANNTAGLEQYAYDDIYKQAYNYIQNQKYAETTDPSKKELDAVKENRPEEYENPYKAEIDAILNEILNRDDFSYDAASDPLYQQYAQMYQREGDRAMRNTLAEAAAGAGGMNTYAITAAQQANNYYASQLGDKIPELYQLAYDMYLNDKESKVQDLGILQNMDATQYGRYRDTMNDWYNDKNFAYGAYQDAIAQGNWEKSFDYNSMQDARNWDNEQYWANKQWDYNDFWQNKQWDYGVEQDNKEWSEQEKADAKAEVEYWMNKGIMPGDELIGKSGMDKSLIEQRVKQVQIENGVYG